MSNIRVGVQLAPQNTTYAAYAKAVCEAESLGVDTIFNWDHLIPGWLPKKKHPPDPDWGNHFEAWTLLASMATLTHRAEIGCLVTCISYRNPALLSNMAKTVDHISNGRLILGLGAGWYEKEYREYGFLFGTAGERLKSLENGLIVIKERWAIDKPLPVRQAIPILIGGGGERVTLRIAAQYADIWNCGGSPKAFKHKCAVLDGWCEKVGRDPEGIERSVVINGAPEAATCDRYVTAGAGHIILNVNAPWDMNPVEQLVRWRDQNYPKS